MVLTQQHIIKPNNKYYDECLNLTHLSKNLYNQTLYRIRQNFIKNNKYEHHFNLINNYVKEHQIDYYTLPTKVSKMTVRKVDKNFKSFFNANKDYKVNPHKYKGKPQIPKYLDKQGNFVTEYYKEAISKTEFKKGFIKPSKTNIYLTFNNKQIT